MSAGRYDVVVVGTRVAGAATAMLLARQGLRGLAVDRASFPSDTVSSHQLQVPGAALLQRWGLLGRLTAAGTPPARRVRFDAGDGLVIDGRFPAYDGVDALYSPLHDHQRHRDRGMYDFTLRLAAFTPASPGQRRFLVAVAADQREADRFIGAFAGIEPPERYFTLRTAVRVLGAQATRKYATAVAERKVTATVQSSPRTRGPAG
jgi:glycine/D-amino acid oxidase-like deaminating enzyme